MFGSCFVMQYYVSFLILQSSCRGRESLLLYLYCLIVGVIWPFLIVLWVDLQCVVVVFSDHTHLLFDCTVCYLRILYIHISFSF